MPGLDKLATLWHSDVGIEIMSYERELRLALEIVRKAGQKMLHYFGQPVPVEEKYDASPVTLADRECENFLREQLETSFAEDGILGEEGTCIPSRSGRRWIIDPIDGTRDFIRNIGFWSIQMALQVGEQIVLGIIYCPAANQMLYAVSGSGCFLNGNRVMASEIKELDKSILMVSGFKAAWDTWPHEGLKELTQRCWTVRCYGGSYDIVMLASGKADIWISGSGMEWDYAPVKIVAAECGARFMTRDGNDRLDARNCLVCAPGLEAQLRKLLGIS